MSQITRPALRRPSQPARSRPGDALRPSVRSIAEMTFRKFASGPALQIFLEATSHGLTAKVECHCNAPRPAIGRVDVLAGVVPLQTLLDVRRQAGVTSRRVALAAKDIDGVRGFHTVVSCMRKTIAFRSNMGAIELVGSRRGEVSDALRVTRHRRKCGPPMPLRGSGATAFAHRYCSRDRDMARPKAWPSRSSRQALRVSEGWRRERDSNPWYDFSYTRFPSVLLQPLGHLSVRMDSIV